MTNAMIIFNESVKLMEAGKIRGTGRFVEVEDQNGNKQQLELPEAIHTYNAWKELGFQVQKGQKAVGQFTIWKYAAGKHTDAEAEEATEEAPGRMFLKKASFFSAAQVQAIA